MIEEKYPPVTKDNLIKGIMKLYFHGVISFQTTVEQIKKVDQDTRVKLERDLLLKETNLKE